MFEKRGDDWWWVTGTSAVMVTNPDIKNALLSLPSGQTKATNEDLDRLLTESESAASATAASAGVSTGGGQTIREAAESIDYPLVDSGDFRYLSQVKAVLDILAAQQDLNAEPQDYTLPDGSEWVVLPGVGNAIELNKMDDGYSVKYVAQIGKYAVMFNGQLILEEPLNLNKIPGQATTVPITGTDHVIHTTADGKTTVIPKSVDPFQLGKILDRGEYKFIQTAPNSFDFLEGPDPNEATVTLDDVSGRLKVTQPDGTISFLTERQSAEAVFDPVTGRFKITQPDGSISFLSAEKEATVTRDPASGRLKVTQPDGSVSFLTEQQEASVERDPVSGRLKVTQPDGSISFLTDRQDATVATDPTGMIRVTQPDGSVTLTRAPDPTFKPGFLPGQDQNLFQQRGGQITQFAGPQLDDIITQSLIDGDFDRAFAFQDFRDRPSAESELKLRMQFARSPADQQLISEIARGQTTVNQDFDPLNPRRIGAQPDFLVNAYNDFLARTQMGRAPTQEEGAALLERLRTGRSPEIDALKSQVATLQGRLEAASLKSDQQKTDFSLRLREEDLNSREQEIRDRDAVGETPPPAALPNGTGAAGETSAESSVTGGLFERLDAAGNQVAAIDVPEGWTLEQYLLGSDVPSDSTFEQIARKPVPLEDVQDTAAPTFQSKFDLSPGSLSAIQSAQAQGFDIPSDFFPGSFGGVDVETGELAQINDPDFRASFGGARIQGLAGGGLTFGNNLEVVGEGGEPELVDLPPGTKVTPISKLTKKQALELKNKGVRGLQSGGITFDGATGTSGLPFGLRRLQAAGAIGPTRGRLLRSANLQLPSQQALGNLTPESVAIFGDLAAQAGIPPGALAQELASTIPGGTRLPIGRRRPLQLAGIR